MIAVTHVAVARARADAKRLAMALDCTSVSDFMHKGREELIEINRVRAELGTWSYERMDPQYRATLRGGRG